MAKVFYITIFLWLGTTIGYAQGVKTLHDEILIQSSVNKTITKSIQLKNDTQKHVDFYLRGISDGIGSFQKIELCYGEDCFDLNKNLKGIYFTLAPGESTQDLKFKFATGLTSSSGNFDILFALNNNPRDLHKVHVAYAVSESNTSKTELNSFNGISLGNISPNPVENQANIDYRILDDGIQASITISDVLGSPLKTFNLDQQVNKVSFSAIDFRAGIYFYTLQVNGKNIVTKKFVVKR